jgi:Ca2+-binding RTX toxin-like protein
MKLHTGIQYPSKVRRLWFQFAAGILSLHLGLAAATVQGQSGVCYAEFPSLPVLLGNSAADTINGTNSSERICGFQGNDIIRGSGGEDKINGNEGNDNINGGEGNDLLRGGKDDDTIDGWNGNDKILGDLGNDRLDGSNGEDLIYGGDGNDTITGGFHNDTIYGENGPDIISGYYGNDILNGNAGNDTVDGGSDNDNVYGGQNDDTVRGGYGADNVAGDLGNDQIYGNRDNDNLWGGDGLDNFYYYNGDGHDVIWDFRVGVDKLRILNVSSMSPRREGNDCVITINQRTPGSVRLKNVATCSGIISAAEAELLPHLTINLEEGAPSSIFTVIGSGFNPGETTILHLNEQPWRAAQADEQGNFALLVDTQNAALDMYTISAPAYQQTHEEMSLILDPVAVQFTLSADAAVQIEQAPAEISPLVIYRLSLQRFVYLPLVQTAQE